MTADRTGHTSTTSAEQFGVRSRKYARLRRLNCPNQLRAPLNFMSEMYLTNHQYLETLERLKGLVKAEKLDYYDDTTVGDKNTECTWGLCRDDLKLWPTIDLHLFPKEFPRRSDPKYRKQHHVCPNDFDPKDQNGCFYHCRFFQKKADGWGRQEVLTKIDELVAEFKKKYKA